MRTAARRFCSGLSLIEIIVSLVLLSIVMAGMANLFIATKRYMQHSRLRTSGGELGRYFLDPIQVQVNEAGWSSSCLGAGTSCPGQTNIGTTNYSPSYSVTNVSGSDLRKVTVNITWNETSP